MADIFISYVRSDRPKAERLANALLQDGWTIWWDTTLLAGDSFEAVITEELRIAKCVIVLWSAASLKSDWVRDEAAEAKSRAVLVPCLIEPVLPPMGYRQYHAEDLSRWDGNTSDSNFHALKRAIARHVPAQGSGPSVEEHAPPQVNINRLSTVHVPDANAGGWREKVGRPRQGFLIAFGATAAAAVLAVITIRYIPPPDYASLLTPIGRGFVSAPAGDKSGAPSNSGAGIIGFDDLTPVAQTTKFPWSGVCALFIRASDGASFRGTGFVIGPMAVLTADYVVFLSGQRGPAVEVQIIPALNGTAEPFGRFVSSSYHRINMEGNEDDSLGGLAVIELREAPESPLTPLPLALFKDADRITLAGYAADRDGGRRLHESSGLVIRTDEKGIYYDADTVGGMGGAPVWQSGGDGSVVGLHLTAGAQAKRALRFTKPLLQRLRRWTHPQSSSLDKDTLGPIRGAPG